MNSVSDSVFVWESGEVHYSSMEGSSNPNESQKPNPSDYEEEVRNFRKEASLTREIQENYKREALRKCLSLIHISEPTRH